MVGAQSAERPGVECSLRVGRLASVNRDILLEEKSRLVSEESILLDRELESECMDSHEAVGGFEVRSSGDRIGGRNRRMSMRSLCVAYCGGRLVVRGGRVGIHLGRSEAEKREEGLGGEVKDRKEKQEEEEGTPGSEKVKETS